MARPGLLAPGTGLGQNTASLAAAGAAAIGVVETPSLTMAGETTRPAGHATTAQGVGVAKAPGLAPADARSLPNKAPGRALLRVAPELQAPAVTVVLDEPETMAAQATDVEARCVVVAAMVRRVLPTGQAISPAVEVVRGRAVATPAVVPRPSRRAP